MPVGKTIQIGPWPRGLDNVSPDAAVAKDALRSIVNCDVLDDGTIRRRSGVTLRVSGPAHSVWASDGLDGGLYAVINGTLVRYTRGVSGALTGTVMRTAMNGSEFPVAFVEIAGEVYYSNGVARGKIVGGVHGTWGVERPWGQPVLAAITSGALHVGRHQVAITFVTTPGEESGTGNANAVDVAEGGGIVLSGIPQPVDPSITGIRVYVSGANGEVLYHHGDFAVGTTNLTLTRSSTLGKALDTQFLIPPVFGTILESFNGRIYIGVSNVIYYTEPLRYGAMRLSNYLSFEDEVRIIKDGEVGLWVATASRTILLQGSGPENFQPIDRLAYGAANGTVTKLPGGKLFWMSSQGPVVVSLGGDIEDLTDDQGDPLVRAAVDAGSKGACVYSESRGVRQIVACVRGTGGRSLVSQDYIDLPGA